MVVWSDVLFSSLGLSNEHRTRVYLSVLVGLGGTFALCSLFRCKASPRKTNTRDKLSTDFNTFLKKQAPSAERKNPTDFSTFIRAPPQAQDAANEAGSCPEGTTTGARPSPDQAVVTILFGTEYGFSKEIAEKLQQMVNQHSHLWARVVDMADQAAGMDLAWEQVLLVVCSTQGDGVPPSEAREFCDWLSSSAVPPLPDLRFSVCALGDRSYVHYCACGKMLDARLEELGAGRVSPRVDVNREDWKAVDGWLSAVCREVAALPIQPVSQLGGFEPVTSATSSTAKGVWGKSRPYPARVVRVEPLCHISLADDKDTVAVQLDLGDSGFTYTPGDALGIYPSNNPQAVEELLQVLGAGGNERIPTPAWHHVSGDGDLSLQEALLLCYDLRCPRPSLLSLLQVASSKSGIDAAQPQMQSAIGPLTNGHTIHANGGSAAALEWQQVLEVELPDLDDEAAVEAYLQPRHIIDVLLDFKAGPLPLDQVLKGLRPLIPRLYSISSSLRACPGQVQATIAAVRYSSLNRQRTGVASTHAADRLKEGDTVPVYISRNPDFRLPPDPATPIIMVGPGTGLAPFKSFMEERIAEAEASGRGFGQSVLYFGCRRADQDFIHGDLLQRWTSEGHLTLFTAFSREQGHKVYVQDRMRESGSLIWRLLSEGAHFYVCGDAAHMAGAVEATLLSILCQHLGNEKEAEAFLGDLQRTGRYQRDVWY